MLEMRDAGEDAMCGSFAGNKGVRQENESIRKRQTWGFKGEWKGDLPGSTEQGFAPEAETSPPTSSPWPSPVRSTEPNRTGPKANLKRFLYLSLALNVRLSLGPGWGGEPL